MKRLIFILNYCFIGFASISQNGFIKQNNIFFNTEFKDSIITISNPRIFRYLPYSFNLSVSDSGNILIEGRNISISKDFRNSYRLNISDSILNGGQIIIYELKGGNKTKICDTFIKVYDTPITLSIANKKSGSLISIEEIQRNRITAGINNYDIDLQFPVKSFKMLIMIGNSLIEIKEESFRINGEQIEYLKKMKDKQPIIFKDIYIEKQNGELMEMEPLIYFLDKRIK